MNACCYSTTSEAYQGHLAQANGSDSVLRDQLDRLSINYPTCWRLFKMFADIRVANIDHDVTARSMSAKCPVCGETATLVLVSAPLMLMVYRTLTMYMAAITKWEYEGQNVKIEYRQPSQSERERFRKMVDEYLGKGSVEFLSEDDELSRLKDVPVQCKQVMFRAIELAQLWIVGHEVAHAVSLDILSRALPPLMAIREGSRRTVEEMGIMPMAAEAWEEEFNADLTSINFMFQGNLMDLSNDANLIHRETVGSRIAGGVGAACEVMLQLVRAVEVNWLTPNEELDHPPLVIRWAAARSYIQQITAPRPGVSLFYEAEVIAHLSHLFNHR